MPRAVFFEVIRQTRQFYLAKSTRRFTGDRDLGFRLRFPWNLFAIRKKDIPPFNTPRGQFACQIRTLLSWLPVSTPNGTWRPVFLSNWLGRKISPLPVASFFPSLLNASDLIPLAGPFSLTNCAPDLRSQIRIVSSLLPDASLDPSGLNERAETDSVWPLKTPIFSPDRAFQIQIALFPNPAATLFPSLLQAMQKIEAFNFSSCNYPIFMENFRALSGSRFFMSSRYFPR